MRPIERANKFLGPNLGWRRSMKEERFLGEDLGCEPWKEINGRCEKGEDDFWPGDSLDALSLAWLTCDPIN